MTRTPRRTARHCDDVEALGATVVRLRRVWEEATEDGLVCPGDQRLLMDVVLDIQATYAPVVTGAVLIDTGARLMGALANTWDVTPWVERMARECADDEAALAA